MKYTVDDFLVFLEKRKYKMIHFQKTIEIVEVGEYAQLKKISNYLALFIDKIKHFDDLCNNLVLKQLRIF